MVRNNYSAEHPDFTRKDLGNSKVATLSGGSGGSMVQEAMKNIAGTLDAVVSVTDDGGNSGKMRKEMKQEARDERGILPPGDILQNSIAQIDETFFDDPSDIQTIREWLNYRFPNGDSLGNLMNVAGQIVTGSMTGSSNLFSKVIRMKGHAHPVTNDDRHLIFRLPDGQIVYGEHASDEAEVPSWMGVEVEFNKPTEISPQAEAAIKQADVVILGPGSLYTSQGAVANKNIKGMTEALKAANCIIAIVNIMNDRHTKNYDVINHVNELHRMIGAKVIDIALFHATHIAKSQPDDKTLARYLEQDEAPVPYDLSALRKVKDFQPYGADLISDLEAVQGSRDKAKRSLVRHDPVKVGSVIGEIVRVPIQVIKIG